jgi:cyanophycinase
LNLSDYIDGLKLALINTNIFMKPKGTLIIIGGAEDMGVEGQLEMADENKEFVQFEILKQLIPKKKNGIIEIITTATSLPKETFKSYQKAFKKLDLNKIGGIDIKNRLEAEKKEYIERIKKASTVLFSGGDQFKLSVILASTDIMNVIIDRFNHDPDFIVAGTSAGAMAMPKVMLYEGKKGEAILMGHVHTSAGLELIDGCIIDTHFIKRGRFGRLIEAVILNPSLIGIGLGEDTALKITEGDKMECLGSGMVLLIDAREIKKTNIPHIETGKPIYVENLKVHVLTHGTAYSLLKHEFLAKHIKKGVILRT